MNRRQWWHGCVLLLLGGWAGICFGQAGTATAGPFILAGKVAGGSGKHAIHVALWDARGFLDKAVREIRVDPGAAPYFRFDVPRGRWALSAFEDVNDNGKLDMGMFGPKEPSGFWRPFHAWHKPRFDDVAVEITQDRTGVEIRLGGNATKP